ncbi:creatininase family protein [Maribacter sp. HS]|uniref:creatininase family protein n=1 Tax=Maribacter sp. HS TaxID=3110480 RepID=UPI003A83B0ED
MAAAQTNPLWKEAKIKNYLPHMTVPEVESFLEQSDMVIIPIGALEQHSSHLPIGTDFINGVELCKLIAQEREVLVAPVLMAGQSPYHMAFPGTISLSAETIVRVHMETVESLVQNGFKRFIFMNSHGGNRAITTFLVDQINQKTAAVAVDFSVAVSPFLKPENTKNTTSLDRHAGVSETCDSLYLMPSLVEIERATDPGMKLPKHLEKMLPEVIKEEPTAKLLFLSEALKAAETGKKTSTIEMTKTGVWGELNPKQATVERGEERVSKMVAACTGFIDKWNELTQQTI